MPGVVGLPEREVPERERPGGRDPEARENETDAWEFEEEREAL